MMPREMMDSLSTAFPLNMLKRPNASDWCESKNEAITAVSTPGTGT